MSTSYEYDNMPEPEVWKRLKAKLKPDSVTGQVGNNDLLTLLKEHENDPDLQRALADESNMAKKREQETDLETYNWGALSQAIEPLSVWRIHMEYSGIVDPETDFIVEPHELAQFPNARHSFRVLVDVPVAEWSISEPDIRYLEDYEGLPKSDDILLFLKKTFATPIFCFRPALPNLLWITHKFEPHRAVIAPFLDSIPAPFKWTIEDAEAAETMGKLQYEMAKMFYRQHMATAKTHKEAGNAAFRKGDRKTAIFEYTQAFRRIEDARCQKVLDEEKVAAMTQIAIAFANRSAAALLPGEGQDITAAINDGRKAIVANRVYAKGYARLAKALEAKGDRNEALDALADGLRIPELENEKGLVEMFIDMQTDGKGLPEDEEEFKRVTQRILYDDEASAKRVEKIRGLWRKRVTERGIC